MASTQLAIESPQDVRLVVHDRIRVRGEVRTPGGAALPPGLRVALVPTLLGPSALFPAESVALDAAGTFDLAGGPGEHELHVEGLPAGWSVRRLQQGTSTASLPALWLVPGSPLEGIRVELVVMPAAGGSRR